MVQERCDGLPPLLYNCTRLCQLLDPEEFYVNPSAFQRRNDSMESSFTEHVRHYVKAASHLIPTVTL